MPEERQTRQELRMCTRGGIWTICLLGLGVVPSIVSFVIVTVCVPSQYRHPEFLSGRVTVSPGDLHLINLAENSVIGQHQETEGANPRFSNSFL